MENKERVLRFSDLLAILLRGMKSILCIAIVVALLGTAFSLYKMRAKGSSPLASEADVNEAKILLFDTETAYETAERELKDLQEIQLPALNDKFESVKKDRDYYQTRLNADPYMLIDPDSVGTCIVTLHVENKNLSEDADSARIAASQETLSSLIGYISRYDSAVLLNIGKMMGVDSDAPTIQQFFSVSTKNDVIYINVKTCDQALSEKIADYLCDTVSVKLKELNDGYSVSETSRYLETIPDSAIKNTQQSNRDALANYEQAVRDIEAELFNLNHSIMQKQSELDQAQSDLDDAKANLEKTELMTKQFSSGFSLRSLIRSGILSLVLGLLIGCMVSLFKGVFSVKLQSQSDLVGRYSFPLLGLLPSKEKQLFSKAIKRLEGERDVEYDLAARTAAQSLLSVTGERSVCLVSSLGKDTAEVLLPYLNGRVPVCGDILADPDAVKELADFDGIALVEQRGRSNLSLIDSEVQRAKALGKEILGIILS